VIAVMMVVVPVRVAMTVVVARLMKMTAQRRIIRSRQYRALARLHVVNGCDPSVRAPAATTHQAVSKSMVLMLSSSPASRTEWREPQGHAV
jgi:hypothetical protein